MKRTAIAAIALAVGFVLGAYSGAAMAPRATITIPACFEDEVLQGVGDFEAGVWAGGYVCRNVD